MHWKGNLAKHVPNIEWLSVDSICMGHIGAVALQSAEADTVRVRKHLSEKKSDPNSLSGSLRNPMT